MIVNTVDYVHTGERSTISPAPLTEVSPGRVSFVGDIVYVQFFDPKIGKNV